jgi:hypothetical protein
MKLRAGGLGVQRKRDKVLDGTFHAALEYVLAKQRFCTKWPSDAHAIACIIL